MSSVPDQAQRAAGTQVIDEVRIALAMSGGIALTVYEAGVAHELWRAATALDLSDERFGEDERQAAAGKGSVPASTYRAVLKKVGGQLVLDVLTGASAGGINAVLLGSTLSTGGDFGALHDLWLEAADIDKLEYRDTVPKSLLDSGVFRGPLRQALEKNQRRSSTPARGKEDLILVVTRTNLGGRRRILTDALGHHAVVETKEDPIRFESLDFCDGKKLDELVNAALATSAFPVVFPPVKMGQDYYADGGLLDNQPVGQAIKAIRDKKAAHRTHRFVVFVEPNPESLKKPEQPPVPPAPSVGQVALQVPLLGIKGNIWNAVTDMEEFNRRRVYYAGLVGALSPERDQVAAWLRESENELFKRAFDEIRFDELFLAHDNMRYARWKTIEEVAFPTKRDGVSAVSEEKATWIRDVVAGTAEVDHYLRWLRALLREINRTVKDETTPEEAKRNLTRTPDAPEPSDKEALYDLLDKMLTKLYPRGAQPHPSPYNIGRKIDGWQKRIEDGQETQVREDLDKFVQEVREHTATSAAPVAADIKEQVGRRALSHAGFYQICLRVSGITEQSLGGRTLPPADLGEHLFTMFKQRDIVDYVLDAATDLHQKDDIRFVRVSPNDADNLTLIGETQPDPDVSLAKVKLAGELFGHMGGFLEEWWRRNDYIWGRLDAAEVILKLLAQVYQLEAGLDARVSAVRGEILEDEYWRYKQRHEGTKLPSKPAVDQPQRNREWIGYGWQTLASLYPDKITHVMRYLFDTSLALARGNPWVPANALDRVSRMLRALAVVVGLATWPARAEGVPSRIRASMAWRSVIAGVVLLAAGLVLGHYSIAQITGALVAALWIIGVVLFIFVLGAFAGWRFWIVVPVTAVLALGTGMWAHGRMTGTWALPGWLDVLWAIAVFLAVVFLWKISNVRPGAS